MPRERRVAFLARDLVWADDSGGSLPFSYAARKLDASLRSAPGLDVETTLIDLRTDDADAFFERIVAFRPSVVAASTYIWSIGLFTELAARVKAWDPSVRFVMGGPAARPSVLALAPYAPYVKHLDAVVTGEGEEVMRCIARDHLGDEWTRTVPGLSVPGALGWRRTDPMERPQLDDYASPYQLGTVPRGEEMGFLETFRGCPISCAFCQWGEERADRVHSAPYLAAHLRGVADAGVKRVYVVDAGFNLSGRAFRNLVAAEKEVGALRTRQILGHVYPSHLKEEHLAFFDHVGRAEVAVGVQSFDSEVLARLGRPFDLAKFESVLGELRKRTKIDLELILGLPGDDPASFRRTFEKAIGIASTVRVFYCLALPDALLERAAEFDVDFDPTTFMVRSCRGWTADALRAEWGHVLGVARQMKRPSFGPNWVDFLTPGAVTTRGDDGESVAPDVVARLEAAVLAGEDGWRLRTARSVGGRVVLDLATGAGSLVLDIARARAGERRFTEQDGVAYSYRGALGQGDTSKLERLIRRVHGDVRPVLFPAGGA